MCKMGVIRSLTMQQNAFSLFLLTVASFNYVSSDTRIVYPCVTPNNESAYCVSLFNCPHLLTSLSALKPEINDYVRSSICLDCRPNDFMVCCGTPENFPFKNLTTNGEKIPSPETVMQSVINTKTATQSVSKPDTMTPSVANSETFTQDSASLETTTKNADPAAPYYPTVQDPVVTDSMDEKVQARREYVKTKLLFSTKHCGMQQNDDRYSFVNGTELDEFPWLAHLKLSVHDYDSEYGDRCNGVLINNRYILTDAYCGYEAVRVILGQYNSNQSFTCFDAEQGDCSFPKVEYRIESKVRSGKQAYGPYDLCLLRLNKKVAFSDYVRPICLPIEGSKRSPSENYLTFSGWGAANSTGINKKKLAYNLTDSSLCYNSSIGLDGNVKFAGVSHVCLKPPPDNTVKACSGEHGGPLMYKTKNNWYADGIIIEALREESPGNHELCSNQIPVSGIFITPDKMNWILDNIKD